MTWLPGPETRAAVMRHPFFLAGLAVVALLGLTAGVLIVIDSARGEESPQQPVIIDSLTTTPQPESTAAPAIGVSGRTRVVVTVRTAPGARTAPLGTLPRNTDVEIDGRTDESEWMRIVFPRNSDRHGWVEAESLEISGDPATLIVATAEPPAYVEVPTNPPAPTPEFTEEGPDGSPTPTETPPPGLPDLVIGSTPTLAGGVLFVTVVNQGTGSAVGDIVVAVFNPDGTALLGGATLPAFTLEAGRSIDIGTGYAVTENQTLLLIVDPNGDIEEADNTNNRITVSIAVTAPPPTDVPPPEAPPAGE
jgi:hypothetical protein